MSNVSAQAFREAIGAWNDPHVNALLLAAAEQREQWDVAQHRVAHLEALDRRRFDVIIQQEEQIAALQELNEADNRTQAAYHEQIATLTAERDALNAQLDLYMAENEALHAQMATVTAERDEARAWVRTFAARQNNESRFCPSCGQSCRVLIDCPPLTLRPQLEMALAPYETAQQLAVLTRERDEARAKLDAISRWVDALGAGARVGSESLTIANTITDIMASGAA